MEICIIMTLQNKRIQTGQFFLQKELEPFTDDFTIVEINQFINSKLKNNGYGTPIFDIKVYKEKVSLVISDKNEHELGVLHLKINARNQLYIPKRNEPELGMSLEKLERVFKPGPFNVSDECVAVVSNWINEWKIIQKKYLKEYKFQPKINNKVFAIKVYRNNKEYDLFECAV